MHRISLLTQDNRVLYAEQHSLCNYTGIVLYRCPAINNCTKLYCLKYSLPNYAAHKFFEYSRDTRVYVAFPFQSAGVFSAFTQLIPPHCRLWRGQGRGLPLAISLTWVNYSVISFKTKLYSVFYFNIAINSILCNQSFPYSIFPNLTGRYRH
jgi:hypothetical protein